ncbi:hypothetical protein GCM10010411_66440 [Actinomadura fulvescens]|uniref:Uncharacterized protein n=1 Tax=Actinomadura fulvescens TaxID=46160 RepID=A0ABP6CIM6_9ACTN
MRPARVVATELIYPEGLRIEVLGRIEGRELIHRQHPRAEILDLIQPDPDGLEPASRPGTGPPQTPAALPFEGTQQLTDLPPLKTAPAAKDLLR